MTDLNKKRMAVIAKIAETNGELGKTAMMKSLFVLQQVYKIPLGYNFEIYTYGPYTSDVMEDIDLAEGLGFISIATTIYPSGAHGYQLSSAEKTATAIDAEGDFIQEHSGDIQKVAELFKDKTAKSMELTTTIIYLYGNYSKNGLGYDIETISEDVKGIKPHFSMEDIRKEYRNLETSGILERAV